MVEAAQSHTVGQTVTGLYEQLMTRALAEQLDGLEATGLHAFDGPVGDESVPHVLARHISAAAHRALQNVPAAERVSATNRILEAIGSLEGARERVSPVSAGPRQLLAVAQQTAPGVYTIDYTKRPATPLSETALLTNSPEDPSLGFELRAEIATADHIDLLCAFVKWHGLRVLEQPLKTAYERGVPIRVITTTYMGATERRALDRLARDFGAEVKVNYETRSTRLHAKAWLFRRKTGFDTAYVGSSNLSRAALLDGLEWNVRLSSVATPPVMGKFEATFDAYWSDASFEAYDPDRDADRLDKALSIAEHGRSPMDQPQLSLSGLEVRPYPYQRDMLEQLAVQREIHNRHRNLLVAATGTGKTVMAALDYRDLLRKARATSLNRELRLLFVAHRKEILDQSLRTYQEVLGDANFGESLHSGDIPAQWKHVFASVQALRPERLHALPPDHFDVVVIDEFHHATAATYRRVIDYFRPAELLGLTATPERMDGHHVHNEFFDGHIAAELRLWEALENDLLSPFHYFGITDNTDMSAIRWRRGGYDLDDLSNLFTGNDARATLIARAVADKVSDPRSMRALGFCVSVKHARYMAAFFRGIGIAAIALSSETPKDERKAALDSLRSGALHIIFSVDLFNEGLDIPDVDTILLMRPTSSATIFLQQLGRGLRRSENKAVLTVLDFIGLHRAEFHFEEQFHALTNQRRNRLLDAIEEDFPRLPSGCQIILERKAKERILANIKSRIGARVTQLAEEVRQYAQPPRLATYLADSGRDIGDLYRGGNSWTGLLRRAGLLPGVAPQGESRLLRRASAFLHADDPLRVETYSRLLDDDAPPYDELSSQERAFARMLFFSLWPVGGLDSYQQGFDVLAQHSAVREELQQVLEYGLGHAAHVTRPLLGTHAGLPLALHASYSREEILTALGQVSLGGALPGHFQSGVKWCENIQTDALFVTLDKDEKDFSPTTRYRDFALSETRFHWESQSSTSNTSATGRRYQEHRERGSHVLLFVRRFKNTETGGPQPWMLLGPADFVESQGSRPMGIVWDLRNPMPADMWTYSTIAAG